MKQLEVQIMGQTYLLGCPEGGDARLLEAVERVDTAMCKIRDAGKVRARDRIAVLAALNLAFDVPDRATATPAISTPGLRDSDVGTLARAAGDAPRSAEHNPDSDVLLISLLERLDEALSEDGRLI
jgi:cell division protein ZapA